MTTATSPIIPELPIIRAGGEGEQRATFFELFFDLVYVFAVTQLSHHLLEDISWSGAAQTAFMLVALYWAWNYTTWMTNWFDPDTTPVRLVLVFVMLASLLMAVAIPQGFGKYALLFACAYAGLQIGRNAFVVAVTPRGWFNQNFRQILAWSVLSAPLWVAGGIVDSEALRWVLWLGALGLDIAAPLVTYWLPGVGRTPMSQWQIEGAHFGERFQLFVIIVLGESIVVAGAAASDTGLSVEVVAARHEFAQDLDVVVRGVEEAFVEWLLERHHDRCDRARDPPSQARLQHWSSMPRFCAGLRPCPHGAEHPGSRAGRSVSGGTDQDRGYARAQCV